MELHRSITLSKRPLLKTHGAGAYIGLKYSDLCKKRCQGKGPRFIRDGSNVFYDPDDCDDWLESLPRFENTSQADAALNVTEEYSDTADLQFENSQEEESEGVEDEAV